MSDKSISLGMIIEHDMRAFARVLVALFPIIAIAVIAVLVSIAVGELSTSVGQNSVVSPIEYIARFIALTGALAMLFAPAIAFGAAVYYFYKDLFSEPRQHLSDIQIGLSRKIIISKILCGILWVVIIGVASIIGFFITTAFFSGSTTPVALFNSIVYNVSTFCNTMGAQWVIFLTIDLIIAFVFALSLSYTVVAAISLSERSRPILRVVLIIIGCLVGSLWLFLSVITGELLGGIAYHSVTDSIDSQTDLRFIVRIIVFIVYIIIALVCIFLCAHHCAHDLRRQYGSAKEDVSFIDVRPDCDGEFEKPDQIPDTWWFSYVIIDIALSIAISIGYFLSNFLFSLLYP